MTRSLLRFHFRAVRTISRRVTGYDGKSVLSQEISLTLGSVAVYDIVRLPSQRILPLPTTITGRKLHRSKKYYTYEAFLVRDRLAGFRFLAFDFRYKAAPEDASTIIIKPQKITVLSSESLSTPKNVDS